MIQNQLITQGWNPLSLSKGSTAQFRYSIEPITSTQNLFVRCGADQT